MSSEPVTYYMIVNKSWLKIINYESPKSKRSLSGYLIKLQSNHCIEKRGYFFTDKVHLLDFIDEGDTIVSIKLPQNFDELVVVRDGKGWRSNQIIIENTSKLHDINTVKKFHIVGINDQQVANLAIKYIDVSILYYLISTGVELKSNIGYIHWWNKICMDFNNPERYFVRKLLDLTPFYVVSHGPSRNKNSQTPIRAPFETQVHNPISGQECYVQNFYFTDADRAMKFLSNGLSVFVYKIKPYLSNNDGINDIIREVRPNIFWATCVVNNGIYDLAKEDSYDSLLDLEFNIEDLTIFALKKNWAKIVYLLVSRHNFDTIFKTKLLFTAAALGYENMIYLLMKHQPIYSASQIIMGSELSSSFIMHHELDIYKVADLPVPERFIDTFLVLATVGGSIRTLTAFIKKYTEHFHKHKQIMIMYAKYYSKPDLLALFEYYSNNIVDNHITQ
ncbi:hypothetical protein [Acanthamoeba polyphaga mimivirus]|uniref:Ankyrin repeat protein n=1 Tax=Acanthamoeba polyphaga mimivirus TaxID=212035 RepID=A0A0G2Y6Y4_MIMIV|nr:hypothetical protein [Acanthamoeba polyphaga mimivirus]